MWIGGYKNITVAHNEITNVAYGGMGIRSHMPHGEHYFEDNGITGTYKII